MYQFIRHSGPRRALVGEAPSAAVAFVVAELFYKFHSFTLECAAFLGTWFVLSFAWSIALGALARRRLAP